MIGIVESFSIWRQPKSLLNFVVVKSRAADNHDLGRGEIDQPYVFSWRQNFPTVEVKILSFLNLALKSTNQIFTSWQGQRS